MKYDRCSLCRDNIGNLKYPLCLRKRADLAPFGGCSSIRRTMLGKLLHGVDRAKACLTPPTPDYRSVLCATCQHNANTFPFTQCTGGGNWNWSWYGLYGPAYHNPEGLSDEMFENIHEMHQTKCTDYRPTYIARLYRWLGYP